MLREVLLSIWLVATAATVSAAPPPVFPDGLTPDGQGNLHAIATGPMTFSTGPVDILLPTTTGPTDLWLPLHGPVLAIRQNDATTLFPVSGEIRLPPSSAPATATATATGQLTPLADPPEWLRASLLAAVGAVPLVALILWLTRPPKWVCPTVATLGIVGIMALWPLAPVAQLRPDGRRLGATAWRNGTLQIPANGAYRLTTFNGSGRCRLQLGTDGSPVAWQIPLLRGQSVTLIRLH